MDWESPDKVGSLKNAGLQDNSSQNRSQWSTDTASSRDSLKEKKTGSLEGDPRHIPRTNTPFYICLVDVDFKVFQGQLKMKLKGKAPRLTTLSVDETEIARFEVFSHFSKFNIILSFNKNNRLCCLRNRISFTSFHYYFCHKTY